MPWLAAFAWFALTPADFTLLDSSGRPHSLHEWRKQPILVLAFLGTECPVARSYAGRLGDIAARYSARGVEIIGVDANPSDTVSDIAKLTEDLQLPYPIFRDVNQALANRLVVVSRRLAVVVPQAPRSSRC